MDFFVLEVMFGSTRVLAVSCSQIATKLYVLIHTRNGNSWVYTPHCFLDCNNIAIQLGNMTSLSVQV